MKIIKSEFLTSAAKSSQYPEGNLPEIAFCGRSNVGKSSIINSITGRKALARVSNTPGRTRLVNFFILNDSVYLVDLPGYGYAKVSHSEIENFGKIMEEYLGTRDNIKKLILLVDSRHKPTADDKMMYNYIKACQIPCLIIGTKLDRLKRNEIKKNQNMIRDELQMDPGDEIIFYSSLSKENRDKMLDMAFEGLGIDTETGKLAETELSEEK